MGDRTGPVYMACTLHCFRLWQVYLEVMVKAWQPVSQQMTHSWDAFAWGVLAMNMDEQCPSWSVLVRFGPLFLWYERKTDFVTQDEHQPNFMENPGNSWALLELQPHSCWQVAVLWKALQCFKKWEVQFGAAYGGQQMAVGQY